MATAGAARDKAAREGPASETTVRSFLMTDIEGSTKLWEAHPDEMPSVLDRLDALLEGIVGTHEGRVLRSRGEGDSAFAVFAQTSDAMAAAIELQRDIEAEPWPGEIDLKLRMAIHTGEVVHRFGDFFGPVVNRCARLREAAHGGQILVSQIAADLGRSRLPDGGELDDLGSHRLRDLRWPERVFQLSHTDTGRHFPPIVTVSPRHDNLPRPLTLFLGRETELAHIKKLLGEQRLLVLAGPGGVGKTRLAIEATAAYANETGRRVVFVDLAPLPADASPAATIAVAITEAFGLPADRGSDPTDGLLTRLRDEVVTIVLDNCEHVVDQAATLAGQILDRCPDVTIVATSREVLQVEGETIIDVRPLADGTDVDQAALALFADRASLVSPDFNPTDADLETITAICLAVDGLPLAIELAAARVRYLGLDELRQRIDGHLTLLTNSGRAAAPRQRTIRALIEWSYDLLSEREQLLLRRMSVFAGCARLDRIGDVCADDDLGTHEPLDDLEIIDLLAHLVDKSLAVHDTADGCYRLLVTIRAFATDRLRAAGEADAMAVRHWSHHLAAATAADAILAGQVLHAREVLDSIHADIIVAINRAKAAGRFDVVARLVAALGDYWEISGRSSEVRGVLQLIDESSDTDDHDKQVLLAELSRVLLGVGDLNEAATVGRRALALARELDDRVATMHSARILGNILFSAGHANESAQLWDEARLLAIEAGDEVVLLKIDLNLGQREMATGRSAEARPIFEDVARRAETLGQARAKLSAALGVADIEGRVGDRPLATQLLQRAVEQARLIADPVLEIGALATRAAILTDIGNLDEAGDDISEAIALAKQINVKRQAANLVAISASIAHAGRRFEQAEAAMRESLTLTRELGDEPRVGWILHGLATSRLDLGDPVEAVSLSLESMEIARRTSDQRMVLWNLVTLSRAHVGAGDAAAGEAAGLEGVGEAERLGDPYAGIAVSLYAGQAAVANGHPEVATDCFLNAIRLGDAAGGTPESALAHLELAKLARQRDDGSAFRSHVTAVLDVAAAVNPLLVIESAGVLALAAARAGQVAEGWPMICWVLNAIANLEGPDVEWADEIKGLIGDRPLEPSTLEGDEVVVEARRLLAALD